MADLRVATLVTILLTVGFLNSACVSTIERIIEALESDENNNVNENINNASGNGGGGPSNEPNPDTGGPSGVSVTPLNPDSNRYSLQGFKGNFTQNGMNYTIYVYNNDSESPIIRSPSLINFEATRQDDSYLEFTKYRQSAGVSVGSGNIHYNEYTDKDSEVFALEAIVFNYGNDPYDPTDSGIKSQTDIQVGGLSVSNIPTGQYVYNGNSSFQLRESGYYGYFADFTMNVDFTRSSGNIEIENSFLNIQGELSIDPSVGTYSSENLQFSVNDDDSGLNFDDNASILGHFHNENATGVTGLYSDNTNGHYIGAIWGARTDIR